mgnify:FL=1|jgi:hypothetical protein
MNKKEEYLGRLIVRAIEKIPFVLSNGLKSEITYDIAYSLPKFIANEVFDYIYNKVKK